MHLTLTVSIILRLSLCVPFLPSVSSQLSLSCCLTYNSSSPSVKVQRKERGNIQIEILHRHILYMHGILQNNILNCMLFSSIIQIYFFHVFSWREGQQDWGVMQAVMLNPCEFNSNVAKAYVLSSANDSN